MADKLIPEVVEEKIPCSDAQIFEQPRPQEGDAGNLSKEVDDDETQLPRSEEEDRGAEVEEEDVVDDLVTDPRWQEDTQSEASSTQGEGGRVPQQTGRSSVVAAQRRRATVPRNTNTRDFASTTDYISPEEQLRRLAYCVKFLPSPLYKKERLMPTNPIAQRRCIEEYKAREKRKREERRKELKERRKYLDEEEDEEEEKEEEEKAAKKIKLDIMDLRQKTLKELCAYLDEEEEEEEEKEEKAKKMKLHIKIPRGEVTAKGQKRRQPIPTTRRKKENQTNFRQYINR
ncbi:uncharacterized protein [Phyllobates terribilis]|uniref:uncharacterized protein n=1 Tax=Phyllobates terribilis TaxID=111132 RepID=UPI003CCAE6A8